MLIQNEWINLHWVAHMEHKEGLLIIRWVAGASVSGISRYKMSAEAAMGVMDRATSYR